MRRRALFIATLMWLLSGELLFAQNLLRAQRILDEPMDSAEEHSKGASEVAESESLSVPIYRRRTGRPEREFPQTIYESVRDIHS
ncbi:MAG: hypothetical protein ACO3XO_07770, partial [Bdellovibrionota bacterium]